MPTDGSCPQTSTHGLVVGKEGVLGTLYPAPFPPSGLCRGRGTEREEGASPDDRGPRRTMRCRKALPAVWNSAPGLFLPQHNLAALYTMDLNLPFTGLTSFFLPPDYC